MRVIAPTSSLSVPASSQPTGAQGTGATSFQTRLAAVGGSSSASGLDPTGAEILQHATQEIRAMLRLQLARLHKMLLDLVRDDLREYVVEHLGDEQSGVLIADETSPLDWSGP